VERGTPRMAGALMAPLALALRQRLRGAGLVHADRLFGLRWSGHMTRARLAGLVRNLPHGLSEIYLHPATGPFTGSAPGYGYREELDALVHPEVLAACRDSSVSLGGFSDFLRSATGPTPAGTLHYPDAHHS
jgi:chitin disaccharide deacetylase